jgi:hypothetical protein
MAAQHPTPSPGEWLYQALLGALKGRGIKFEEWCRSHDLQSTRVRAYAFGINAGPQSAAVLEELIDDAGRDIVLALYHHRLREKAAEFDRWAA